MRKFDYTEKWKKLLTPEIVETTPGISTTTVQRTLTDLVKAEKITKFENGRYAKYKWNMAKN